MTIDDKITLIRNKAKDVNVDTEDFNQAIDIWVKEINKANLLKEYREFEISKQICSMLISICLKINRSLINENDLTERKTLQADLSRCKWLLGIYSVNPDDNLKQIETTLDDEIERLGINN